MAACMRVYRLGCITTEVDWQYYEKIFENLPIYKLMLYITSIQLSADIILTVYTHYTEP
jgi:hypothetical protein